MDNRSLRRRVGVSLLNTLREEMRRQEAYRQEADRQAQQQQDAELQALRDTQVVAQRLAAQAVAMSSAHPVAAASASTASASSAAAPQQFSIASPPSASGSPPELLVGTRDVVFTPKPGAPFAAQLQVQPKTYLSMQERVQVKRGAEGGAEGEATPKAKVKPSGATGTAPPAPPPKGGATSSRSRSISKPPAVKREEDIAEAKRLVQDQALRSDKQYLNTVRTGVLRALLQSEGITGILTSSRGRVNTSVATKPELIDETVRHFENVDKTLQRVEQIGASGASSSSAGGVAGVVVKEKKEKKEKKAETAASKKKK